MRLSVLKYQLLVSFNLSKWYFSWFPYHLTLTLCLVTYFWFKAKFQYSFIIWAIILSVAASFDFDNKIPLAISIVHCQERDCTWFQIMVSGYSISYWFWSPTKTVKFCSLTKCIFTMLPFPDSWHLWWGPGTQWPRQQPDNLPTPTVDHMKTNKPSLYQNMVCSSKIYPFLQFPGRLPTCWTQRTPPLGRVLVHCSLQIPRIPVVG